MERNYLRLRTALLTLSLSMSLIACGGGGSSGISSPAETPDSAVNPPSTTHPPDNEESSPSPIETPDGSTPPLNPQTPTTTRINKALSTGDARPLIQQDSATLLDWALQLAKQQQT